ncbi:MAG TPA: AAA family ATPase, partial [Gemmata sp.]
METSSYQFRLKSITVNNGSAIHPAKLTVFVGPNNSGKSQSLRDIRDLCTGVKGAKQIVTAAEMSIPKDFKDLYESYAIRGNYQGNDRWELNCLVPDLTQLHNIQYQAEPDSSPRGVFRSTARVDENKFISFYGKALVAHLKTENRLQLVHEGTGPESPEKSASLLQLLYNSDKEAETEIRKLVQSAFGRSIALDYTTPSRFAFRISDSFEGLPGDPRELRPHLQNKPRLDDQGDGIRSFVGIVVALKLANRGVFLIDEPEAFLHPPQAFRMGATIANFAQ